MELRQSPVEGADGWPTQKPAPARAVCIDDTGQRRVKAHCFGGAGPDEFQPYQLLMVV